MVEIPVRRQIRYKTAGDVDHQTRRLGHLLPLVNLGGVGQNRVDEVGAGRHRLSLIRGGQTATVQGLGAVDHVDHLFLVMADLLRAVVRHHRQGRPDHAVDLAGLAPAVALAVEGGEVGHQVGGKFYLTTEKDPVPGDKNVIKNDRRGVFGIAPVAAVAAVLFPRVQTRPADHVNHARRVAWDGEGHREFLLTLSQRARRQNNDLVRRQ